MNCKLYEWLKLFEHFRMEVTTRTWARTASHCLAQQQLTRDWGSPSLVLTDTTNLHHPIRSWGTVLTPCSRGVSFAIKFLLVPKPSLGWKDTCSPTPDKGLINAWCAITEQDSKNISPGTSKANIRWRNDVSLRYFHTNTVSINKYIESNYCICFNHHWD